MNNLHNTIITHIEHGHLPVAIATILGILALIPLLISFISVTKTYFMKLYSINGLRKYRVSLMGIFLTLIIGQITLIHLSIVNFFDLNSGSFYVPTQFLMLYSSMNLIVSWFTYFLFRHAAKHN
jgi:hypothetical protein